MTQDLSFRPPSPGVDSTNWPHTRSVKMADSVPKKAARMRALAVFFLVAAVSSCRQSDPEGDATKSAQGAIRAATVVAAEKPTPDVLTVTGIIIADQRAEVTADTQGKVINVMIERGQRVKLGQAVIQLDVRTARLSAKEAQAALQSARVSKQLADEECARTKALLEKGAITKAEFDRQNTQCLNAVEQVAQAQARNDMMSKSVADGMVRAPFDGTVSEKHVSPGEWVTPGKPLFTLVDADPLKMELSVPEKAVPAINIGDRVEVAAVAHPDQTFSATITRLGAEIGRSRSLTVEATLDPVVAPEKKPQESGSEGGKKASADAASKGAGARDRQSALTPGMFAEARVTVGHTPRVALPATAVVRRDKIWRAFIVRNGVIEERVVQVGPSPGPKEVSISQGIAVGEKVVAVVAAGVVDGAKVTE